jgi:hypothetical protein
MDDLGAELPYNVSLVTYKKELAYIHANYLPFHFEVVYIMTPLCDYLPLNITALLYSPYFMYRKYFHTHCLPPKITKIFTYGESIICTSGLIEYRPEFILPYRKRRQICINMYSLYGNNVYIIDVAPGTITMQM